MTLTLDESEWSLRTTDLKLANDLKLVDDDLVKEEKMANSKSDEDQVSGMVEDWASAICLSSRGEEGRKYE